MEWRYRERPLRAIQKGALNTKEPVTHLLRKVIALGGRTGSQELMDWARRELNGYGPEDLLPEYRQVTAPLQIDGMTQRAQVRQQSIAPFDLPDFARPDISNQFGLRMSISEVEHLVKQTPRGDVVKLAPPGADDLVSIMNRMGAWTGHIERLYWSVSPVALVGLIDGVRNALVSLTAQMEAVTPPAAILPSQEGTAASVALAVYGDRSKIKNVTIYNANGDMAIATDRGDSGPRWRRWWVIAGGVIALASASFAFMQVQGWRF